MLHDWESRLACGNEIPVDREGFMRERTTHDNWQLPKLILLRQISHEKEYCPSGPSNYLYFTRRRNREAQEIYLSMSDSLSSYQFKIKKVLASLFFSRFYDIFVGYHLIKTVGVLRAMPVVPLTLEFP